VYQNATDGVEIRRGLFFSVTLNKIRQTLCRLAPTCPFHLPFPSFSDEAEARSYFASTLRSWTAIILGVWVVNPARCLDTYSYGRFDMCCFVLCTQRSCDMSIFSPRRPSKCQGYTLQN
jgi:hypothetical protein